MAIGSPQWMYKSGEAYEIDQSLRFNDDDSAYLSWTPSSAGNRTTWTWSGWIKLGSAGDGWHMIFSAGSSSNSGSTGENLTGLLLYNDTLYIYWDSAAGGTNPAMKLRDPSAWYHVCLVATSSSLACYINGTLAGTKSGSGNGAINNTLRHGIGIRGDSLTSPFDGYMSEIHFIDGTAKAPSNFAETGTYGEWKPIEYSGTYGTNGFYLPFKQDYSVEGFSTVLYKCNNASQYIGGVGFKPDLVWIKQRIAGEHKLYDSVRGAYKSLSSDQTVAEDNYSDTLTAFNTDGFSLGADGTDGFVNFSGNNVAWSWDMGSPSPKQITANGNAKISTTQEKFGSSSAYFDGTGDYLSIPQSYDFDLASSTNFTVECWVYHTDTISGDRVYVSQTEGTYANSWYLRAVGGGEVNLTAWIGGSDFLSVRTGAGVVTQNNWHHVALVKTGTDYKIFIDGTDETDSGGTDSDTATFHSGELRIGDNGSGQYMTGYIDEIRISDTARYSSNFTPSASAFTRDSNTKLLMHNEGANNSTEFLDHSGMDVNTDGSITSNVKANPTYGQSIVSYTGNATAGATVGHGLSSAPEIVITKQRANAGSWQVLTNVTSDYTEGDYLYLNDTVAVANSANVSFLPNSTTWEMEAGQQGNVASSQIAYCFHSVTGYSKIGSYSGNGSASGATQTCGFKPAFVLIKRSSGAGDWRLWDNTRNPESGTALKHLLPNTNASENTSIGIEFLDTGFKCKTADSEINASGSTYIYMAFADKREYAYWLDQSGNNNDWTSNNLTESDISVDSPTNNFCTWNPLANAVGTTLSEGNLKSVSSYSSDKNVFSTFGITSGKWYFEIYDLYQGVRGNILITDAGHNEGLGTNYARVKLHDGGIATSATDNGDLSAFSSGDILCVAVNLDDGEIYFSKNSNIDTSGTAQITNFPLTGTNRDYRISYFETSSTETDVIANFGQDSSFAGNKTAQGNQDSNDIGDFYYTPPTGFLALCTKNLPDVAVTPSEHFNTVIYSGNGSTQSIATDLDPDWVWVKGRSHATSHITVDAVRGDKQLVTNSTSAEADLSSHFNLTTTGFNLLSSTTGLNASGRTYVAWNWKANGSGSSNTNGSVTSTVSANVDAGFSIATWTGTSGLGTDTIGHGLSQAPELIISKISNTGDGWYVYHKDLASGSGLQLNTTAAVASSYWASAPTSTVFTEPNDSTNVWEHVTYCFHSVDGYSKVGSYEGNGNADGTFVYTGFRPEFVMVKRTDAANNWQIFRYDDKTLEANESSAEYGGDYIDIVSNGFKTRSTANSVNGSSASYIYLAFAETPFKYSNAR